MIRLTFLLVVFTLAAFMVTACGKKGGLEQPENVKPTPTYPRTYPSK
ncbi:MAG: hypothetical protein ACKVGZ_04845 [Alphaproteobacteria bacterium]|jgi:predicted small lipoprotein YifL